MSDLHNITKDQRNMILSKKKLCAICGFLACHPTVEHIIPLTVLKWNDVDIENFDDILDDLNSDWNLTVACNSCNVSKGTYIPSKRDVMGMWISNAQKDTVLQKLEEYKTILDGYDSIHRKVYDLYEGICQCGCGIRVPITRCCIMRKSNDSERTVENSCIIYNTHATSFSKRKNTYI